MKTGNYILPIVLFQLDFTAQHLLDITLCRLIKLPCKQNTRHKTKATCDLLHYLDPETCSECDKVIKKSSNKASSNFLLHNYRLYNMMDQVN